MVMMIMITIIIDGDGLLSLANFLRGMSPPIHSTQLNVIFQYIYHTVYIHKLITDPPCVRRQCTYGFIFPPTGSKGTVC